MHCLKWSHFPFSFAAGSALAPSYAIMPTLRHCGGEACGEHIRQHEHLEYVEKVSKGLDVFLYKSPSDSHFYPNGK